MSIAIRQATVADAAVIVEFNRRLAEEIRLPQRRLLPVAVEQIKELRLERGARTVGVEIGEERVFHFLEHDRGVEARAETLRQSGFARADRSFDGDVPELQGGPMISSAP